MARILAEEVMGLIIGAFLGVVGTLTSPGTVNLLPNPHETTVAGVCEFQLFGLQTEKQPCAGCPLQQCSAFVRCGDSYKFYRFEKDGSCKVNKDYPINDPNIGALNIFFQPSKFNTAPFPGDVLLQNDKFKTKSENHGMRLSDGVKYSGFTSKDCKGKTVKATVCKEGFPDGSTGNLSGIKTKGWAYYVGFPTGGRSAGCPKKREIEWEG